MTAYRSSLLKLLDERGYIHQVTDAAALDALAAKETVTAYIGFDATAPSLHVGSLVQIMMLRRLQQAGHKPIVLMGGGTTKVGDPVGQGREPQASHRRADRRQYRRHPPGVRALPDLRRRADRRGHGQQCRLARRARLHPLPARGRAAFHDQPHADLRQRQAAARPRAADDLPRIQLHDPPGLRLPGAVAAGRLPAADGRLRPMGRISSTASSLRAGSTGPSCSASRRR